MSKGKLAKFADMATYENVFQYPYSVVEHVPFELKGHWHERYFKNQNPIVLELGCGKGEYTVELAKLYPQMNFIGVDIKGARMWTGATQALNEGLKNVAFLRTNIEIIERFFAEDEVQAIWLTFSDPQMKNPRKRLTSTYFLARYRQFLVDGESRDTRGAKRDGGRSAEGSLAQLPEVVTLWGTKALVLQVKERGGGQEPSRILLQ